MQTKICTKCKKELPITKFHKDKYRKDGLCCVCKLCKEVYRKIYYRENKEKELRLMKQYQLKHKEELAHYQLIYSNNKYRKCINFRISKNLRNRINLGLKLNIKSKSTIQLLGCSIEELKKHLEKKFIKGMSFDNYGKWHIDHIRPCASFDLSKVSEQRKCFHYTNLQPLWAEDNRIKSNKL